MAKALMIVAAVALLALSGCATSPPVHLQGFIAYWCATNEPERPSRVVYASMTETARRDMNAHNTYGAKHCGWKP